MGKIITLLVSIVALVVVSGCNGTSSSATQASASTTQASADISTGDTQTEIPGRDEYYREPRNTSPVAYVGKDRRKVSIGSDVNVVAALIPDKEGDKLAYIWALTDKPEGSNADLTVKYSTGRTTSFHVDAFGKYTVALLVRDENGGTGADTITFSTALEADDFSIYLGSSENSAKGKWKGLSGVNNPDADADVLTENTPHGRFYLDGEYIVFEEDMSNPLPNDASESTTLRIYDDADEIVITVTVVKNILKNGSFETGDLTGWTAQGGAEVLQKSNFSPSDINASEGNYFLLLSSGPGSNGLGAAGDIDGDGVMNYDASNVRQIFSVQTDTVLSFDIITFLTDEGIGYYDEIFQVLIDGVDVAHGSTPGTNESPFENFGGSVNNVDYSVSSSGILNGSSFASGKTNGEHFVIPISAGTHTIKFLVADKGDTVVDTAIVIDNVVVGH